MSSALAWRGPIGFRVHFLPSCQYTLAPKKGKNVRGEGGKGGSRGSKGARREPPPFLVGSRMAAEGQEVTAGAAAVLARRKDRPPLPRSLREAANEETSDEEWCAAEEQCEEDHETRIFLPASKYGRVRIHQAPRAQKEGTGHGRGAT